MLIFNNYSKLLKINIYFVLHIMLAVSMQKRWHTHCQQTSGPQRPAMDQAPRTFIESSHELRHLRTGTGNVPRGQRPGAIKQGEPWRDRTGLSLGS